MSYFPSLFSLAGLKHMQKSAHTEASACIPSDIQFKQAIAPVKQNPEGSCTKYGAASGDTRLENEQAANLRAAAQLSLTSPASTVGMGRTQTHRQSKGEGMQCVFPLISEAPVSRAHMNGHDVHKATFCT